MWNVTETQIDGTTGNFGPVETFEKAVSFVSSTQLPWSAENLKSILINKE